MKKIKGIGIVAIVGIPTKDGHVFTLEALQKIAASNENMWMVGNELWAEVETPYIAYTGLPPTAAQDGTGEAGASQ